MGFSTKDEGDSGVKCLLTAACMKRNGLEALNFQNKMYCNRSTNFEYTTETIIFYTRCYTQCGLISNNLK